MFFNIYSEEHMVLHRYFCPHCFKQLKKITNTKIIDSDDEEFSYYYNKLSGISDIRPSKKNSIKVIYDLFLCEYCNKEYSFSEMTHLNKSLNKYKLIYIKKINPLIFFFKNYRCSICKMRLSIKYSQLLIEKNSSLANKYNISEEKFKDSNYIRLRIPYILCDKCGNEKNTYII